MPKWIVNITCYIIFYYIGVAGKYVQFWSLFVSSIVIKKRKKFSGSKYIIDTLINGKIKLFYKMRHRENTHLQLRGYSMVSGEFQNVTNLKIASCSFSCKNTNVFFGWVKVFFFSRKQNQDNCNPYFIGLNNQSKVVFKKYDNEKNASSNIQHEEKKM